MGGSFSLFDFHGERKSLQL